MNWKMAMAFSKREVEGHKGFRDFSCPFIHISICLEGSQREVAMLPTTLQYYHGNDLMTSEYVVVLAAFKWCIHGKGRFDLRPYYCAEAKSQHCTTRNSTFNPLKTHSYRSGSYIGTRLFSSIYFGPNIFY